MNEDQTNNQLVNKIAEAAKAPAQVATAEGNVRERSIQEMIEADKYTKASKACKPPYGMRIAKMQFPGTP